MINTLKDETNKQMKNINNSSLVSKQQRKNLKHFSTLN